MKKVLVLVRSFAVPIVVILGILMYGISNWLGQELVGRVIILSVILLGSYGVIIETLSSIVRGKFGLDYIAITAIAVGVGTQEYLVAAILALMVSGGRNLEEYGVSQAKRSLTALIDRIPQEVSLAENGAPGEKIKLGDVSIGQDIFVRKGEVIGLDGELVSETAETDESSLTGEPYFLSKKQGDLIRSGTVNIGQAIVIKVVKAEADSTYRKIINLVQKAQEERSPLVRLADDYSTIFTVITAVIAGVAYVYSGYNFERVLAVLAIATPCPLIIATPIALLGGVNASARNKIIVKKLAALEALARANVILFDKTGTITLGVPVVTSVDIKDKSYTVARALAIADAIERNSLHPLAKAIVNEARSKNVKFVSVSKIKETTGVGISGEVGSKTYTIANNNSNTGMRVSLMEGKKIIAVFSFEDQPKPEVKKIIGSLLEQGYKLKILTGDKQEAADKLLDEIGQKIEVRAECKPQDKEREIEEMRKNKKVTAMVGDGINDAPALALADVGLAFSNEEQTAASEAADIVFLGGSFGMISKSLEISKRTLGIAKQSIVWGIGLSVTGMVFASMGVITPIYGAGLQEAIDVAVILNALRASRQ